MLLFDPQRAAQRDPCRDALLQALGTLLQARSGRGTRSDDRGRPSTSCSRVSDMASRTVGRRCRAVHWCACCSTSPRWHCSHTDCRCPQLHAMTPLGSTPQLTIARTYSLQEGAIGRPRPAAVGKYRPASSSAGCGIQTMSWAGIGADAAAPRVAIRAVSISRWLPQRRAGAPALCLPGHAATSIAAFVQRDPGPCRRSKRRESASLPRPAILVGAWPMQLSLQPTRYRSSGGIAILCWHRSCVADGWNGTPPLAVPVCSGRRGSSAADRCDPTFCRYRCTAWPPCAAGRHPRPMGQACMRAVARTAPR